MIWNVCLSKMTKSGSVKVKVRKNSYVPRRGEKMQIIGRFRSKANAEQVAMQPEAKDAWDTELRLNDETMHTFVPSEDGRESFR